MQKIILIFSLIFLSLASLFNGQVMNFDIQNANGHVMSADCEIGHCHTPLDLSCAEHCFSVAVQNYVLPIMVTPVFVLLAILFGLVSLLVQKQELRFYTKIFAIPLTRRLALNVALRE
ncbi:hypothetical protein COY25_01085 [Candidatus Uhrbacteria bacterium CG_4_10_14_0_2_um_filter_41_7]|uniref:Uncharacterized protein n=1 Tax=Candidatus Uhrbacteria bacterium CG_4_9_14_3_um_filter_41_35 TaxID=1975034 RepID=A0A2M7XGT2_9BACT|nr:MAG: hypothetical protein COV92_00500 [Candidatus Uhrbacteria bacterium CG11_big_fil_rev_8_21_14_0_20_41_9]PIZ55325.1 MAG: hypothetical protein COY25_01085 [Candidatus Uhrbacteria bacterium CG_4_10_14_0_2_um_filter_41_7]PJA47087.1 MAG: hypothetical protein CO173_00285 [Candidatus Uhrbacteria bacterium CG_4_9_14_3_um_filter_41_35]